MKLKTQIFGEIEIDDAKKLVFEQGVIGYPDYREFFLLHDEEREKGSLISWLQSADDDCFALPVVNPLMVDEGYNPMVEDAVLESLGGTEDEFAVFTTIRVPAEIEKMTVNMKAPILVNTATRKCCQLILENQGYDIRKPVYDILKGRRKEN